MTMTMSTTSRTAGLEELADYVEKARRPLPETLAQIC